MFTTEDLLQSYVRLLCRVSGSEAVSLCQPPAPDNRRRLRLIHGNGVPAVPELADADAAGELLRTVEARSAGSGADPPRPVASRAAGGWLIPVPADPRRFDQGPGTEGRGGRRRADRPAAADDPPALWIGLRLTPGSPPPGDPVWGDPFWRRALAHGSLVAGLCRRLDAVLRDPVSELPGRADFQAALRREVASALANRRPLTLLLANPDDFSVVNERFGSEAGDEVVRELGGRLKTALRRSDLVHRYGGVVFANLLPDTSRADAVAVAEKLHAALTAEAYLDGALRLGFSFGLADLEDSAGEAAGQEADAAVWAMIRRADRALNQAKLSSSGRIIAWRPGAGEKVVVHRDRLSGIFTADLAKDYRNMLLLWDTVEMMTAGLDPEVLAARAVERLGTAFKPDRAGLFRWRGGAAPELAAGHGMRGNGSGRPGELVLGAAEQALVERARAEGELVEGRVPAAADGDDAAYALPLLARGECFGCLYLAGPAATLHPDASDLIFLKALAGQLAAALDRAELAARERRGSEEKSRRLAAELEALRAASRETELVYRSPQMEALVATTGRVAPSDATVLVTGDSGSGKELVARMVHALSPRRDRPPVVVDCGAISETLIDSELFGHEKGAYTGAAGRPTRRPARPEPRPWSSTSRRSRSGTSSASSTARAARWRPPPGGSASAAAPSTGR